MHLARDAFDLARSNGRNQGLSFRMMDALAPEGGLWGEFGGWARDPGNWEAIKVARQVGGDQAVWELFLTTYGYGF